MGNTISKWITQNIVFKQHYQLANSSRSFFILNFELILYFFRPSKAFLINTTVISLAINFKLKIFYKRNNIYSNILFSAPNGIRTFFDRHLSLPIWWYISRVLQWLMYSLRTKMWDTRLANSVGSSHFPILIIS